MEATLCFLPSGGDGGGGSAGVSTNESIVCETETAERIYQAPSEESSFSVEAELELGLCLSIGGGHGRGCARVKAGGRSERGRILTAKDFPSAVFNGGFSSSSSSSSPDSVKASSPAKAVSGTKRAAELVSQDGGSPTGSSQVVGWPPIRTYRMNSLVSQTKASNGKSEEDLKKKKKKNSCSAEGTAKAGFVKVSMDGVVIGRKLDLNSHSCYHSLAQAVHHLFFSPPSDVSNGSNGNKEEAKKISRVLDGSAEFVLTYEDKDGDWMLAGDVPWRMFVGSVKKLRIMRTSDANGLCTALAQLDSTGSF